MKSKKEKDSVESIESEDITTVAKVAKNEMLLTTVKSLEEQYGQGVLMLMSETSALDKVEVIETGSLLLNKSLGIGGFPRGRISEVYGGPGVGKTTLLLLTIANAQKNGDLVVFIDVEHAFDKNYATLLGVQMDKLYVSQPSTAEEALDIVESLVRSGTVSLIVVDSVSALSPKSEVEGEMSDNSIGLLARLMSKALRKLVAVVHKSNVALVFINQIRSNISTFSYGPPSDETSGGKALKFYSSIRLELKSIKTLKEKDQTIGSLIRITVKKNKLASPFRVCEVPLIAGIGFSVKDELIDELIKQEIIIKSGAWYSLEFNGEVTKLGQGRDGIRKFFSENENLYNQLIDYVKKN